MPLTEKQAAFWSEYCRICRQSGTTFEPVPDPTSIVKDLDPQMLRSQLEARDRELRPPPPKPAPRKAADAAKPADPAPGPVAPKAAPDAKPKI